MNGKEATKIVKRLAGKTISSAHLVTEPEGEGSGAQDCEKLTLLFTDGSAVTIESADSDGYLSWFEFNEVPRRIHEGGER